MTVRNRMDELEEWCFWPRPQNPQGAVTFSHVGRTFSAPSPEFSDSLDSTITYNQYIDNDGNHEHHIIDSRLLDESNDKCKIRRNGRAETDCSTHSPKTVSINPSPKLLENNQSTYKIRDSVLDNLSSENCKEKNVVRRVASSDSIPCGYNSSILSQGCKVLSQDCVRRSKNPDVKHTIAPLRYIQSAKGTWTYNL